MAVPRTYISKVENGRALPTLGSLERLAAALCVKLGELVQHNYGQREEEIAALMADPFLAEITGCVARLNALQRSTVLHHMREMVTGSSQRKTA